MTESRNKSGPESGFSRRSFLQGTGAIAAATALSAQVAAEEKQAAAVAAGSSEITVTVNGTKQKLKIENRETLLDVLRNRLDLTGAKPVSSDGSSGASTVIVDGKPVMASTTMAVTCDGKSVQTVESLGGKNVDAVCKAFVANDAQQCGFCTPGFVVAVRAFLDKNPDATEQQIRAGLNGNICRCGTYVGIIGAAIDVVKGGA
ncbi:MAG: (2Fe-2S)-binding protein [Pirellulaceae bacterium]